MISIAHYGKCRLGIVFVYRLEDDEIVRCGGCDNWIETSGLFIRSGDRGGNKAGIIYPQCSRCITVEMIGCKKCGTTTIGDGDQGLHLDLLNEDGTAICVECEEGERIREDFSFDTMVVFRRLVQTRSGDTD